MVKVPQHSFPSSGTTPAPPAPAPPPQATPGMGTDPAQIGGGGSPTAAPMGPEAAPEQAGAPQDPIQKANMGANMLIEAAIQSGFSLEVREVIATMGDVLQQAIGQAPGAQAADGAQQPQQAQQPAPPEGPAPQA